MPASDYNSPVHVRQPADALVIGAGGKLVRNHTVADVTTAGAETYTAAQVLGGVITRDPNGAGRTDITDTAANLIRALGLDDDGDAATCYLINTADAAEAITLSGGTGVTIANAGQTVGQNEAVVLLFRRTGAAAVTVYVIGA